MVEATAAEPATAAPSCKNRRRLIARTATPSYSAGSIPYPPRSRAHGLAPARYTPSRYLDQEPVATDSDLPRDSPDVIERKTRGLHSATSLRPEELSEVASVKTARWCAS